MLQWLLEKQLFINGEKCAFHASTVSFLGFIIWAYNIQVYVKGAAVKEWSVPENRQQLGFLAFTNFNRNIIHNHSSFASCPHVTVCDP